MTARQIAPALCLLALVAAPAPAQTSSRYSPELIAPFKPVAAKASESTVRIRCDDNDAALGTVVAADGYILTKASELRGAVTVVLSDGTVHDVELVAVHKPTDLALVKLDLRKANVQTLRPVKFTDSKKVPVGNWLVAPGPGSDPLAVGIVSVMTRDLSGSDARLTINYNRGVIGVLTEDVKEGKGAKITEVSKDSGASKAGLKADDVIIEVNGKAVKDREALLEILSDYQKDDVVRVKVRREDEEKVFKVTLQERKDIDRSEIQNRWGSKLSGRRSGFPTILQTDMVVDADKCGGPVCDLEGNVLGISIARAGRVETWVLPSETIRPLLSDMKAGKYPPDAKKSSDN
ncbi:MAG TPA: PDZ domain-containing protein [Gemmataceae bacterium]|nr:PDZ domain-containing protein [Gemmataceae bacterium]